VRRPDDPVEGNPEDDQNEIDGEEDAHRLSRGLSPVRGSAQTRAQTIRMSEPPARVTHDLPNTLARLRGLFEIAALPSGSEDRAPVFGEIARAIGESLGYGTVAINLLRPAWDDFEVVAVHGDNDAKDALLGATTTASAWEPFLTEQFYARGAYLVPHGSVDWSALEQATYVPDRVGESEWDPEDALFVPMRDAAGRLIGVLSVDAPANGRRPTDPDLDALVSVAAYAARAVESAEVAARETQRRRGLEVLLELSAKLTSSGSTQEILDDVCEGIRDALGFELVVIELADHDLDRYRPLAAVGVSAGNDDIELDVPVATLDAIFDPHFEIEGCFLLSREEALARVRVEPSNYRSTMNGTSPAAWNRHWLIVPLAAPDGGRLGFIWVDDPQDRLLPSRSTLQVLRTFANQAATAIEAARRRSALERRTAELEALHETTLALLQQNNDPGELLEAIVARAAELLGTPHGYLYRVDAQRGRLVLDIALGVFADYRGTELDPGEGLSGRVWDQKKPLSVRDYSRWAERAATYAGAPFSAAAGIPLVVRGDVVGVLGVGYDAAGRTFGEAEIALLSRIARLASLVLEQAELSRKLSEERDYSKQLIESAKALVLCLDREGRIEVFNAEAARVTGYAPEEIVGRDPWELLVPDGLYEQPRESYLQALVKDTLPETFESPIVTKDGEERLISWANRVVFVDGEPRGSIHFGIDVTDRRRLEEELRQSQKMEAVGRLAGGVAHDFNNLLTAISGYGELALAKLEDSPAREHVFEMKRAGERAADLTRQLLAFSRRQVLQSEVVDLNAIVADLERLLGRLLGAQIELSTKLDPRLGSTRADPGQLEQVVMNLALNARDAMPGGGRLTIATRNERLGGEDYVALEVSDTGQGMDAETLEQAFEPFFTTKPAGEGTGLGLATVYGIVKQSGGDVIGTSTPGRGTTMRVLLPRVSETVTPEDETPEASGAAGGSTVLLVEDEEVVRRLVATMLLDAGCRVLEAEDASSAIVIADGEADIDILLTDVVMPGLSGPDLASLLLDLRPELRVLFMSGYTAEMISRGELEEGTSFLQKPFTRAELVGALDSLGPDLVVA
jgi:PAS domain S-box-containing protein